MAHADRISTRIDAGLKKRAGKVLRRLGLTEAEAIRLFFAQVELRQAIPFEVKIPNAETLAALEEAQNADALDSYNSSEELIDSLDR